jgi:hypothetical protein
MMRSNRPITVKWRAGSIPDIYTTTIHQSSRKNATTIRFSISWPVHGISAAHAAATQGEILLR